MNTSGEIIIKWNKYYFTVKIDKPTPLQHAIKKEKMKQILVTDGH